MNLNERETATVIAALRLWQEHIGQLEKCNRLDFAKYAALVDIATSMGGIAKLTPEEIDELCIRFGHSDQYDMPIPIWLRDDIQFPRLIAEICRTLELSKEDVAKLADSMDLEDDDVHSLFDRACSEWEHIKKTTCPVEKWEVSLPATGGMVQYATFGSKDAALRFAKTEFGADENGNICLLNKLPSDAE